MNERYSSNPFYIPKINSRAYGVSLYRNVTAIKAKMVVQSFNEQRKYPRFRPDTKIFIHQSTQGTVENIGIGGLSYTYYHLPKASSEPLPKVSTIFSAEKHKLMDIPCTVVSDRVIMQAYSFFPEIKHRRVRFCELSEEQLQWLEQFILTHATVPELDIEEKTQSAALEQFDHAV